MKFFALMTVLLAFVFTANANEEEKENKDNFIEQIHPKQKTYSGKTVTHISYVKTSNPKRLHWNRAYEGKSSVKSTVINQCPKRKNLVCLLSLEKKAGDSSQSPFVKRKRHR